MQGHWEFYEKTILKIFFVKIFFIQNSVDLYKLTFDAL